MSKHIFSEKIDYVNRFVKNHGKQLKFPSFIYNDVKLHPKHRDHIVVLSETKLPSNKNKETGLNKKFNMKHCMDNNFMYSLAGLPDDEKTKEIFKEEIINAEKEVEEEKASKNVSKNLKIGTVPLKTSAPPAKPKKSASPHLDNADKLIEETKGLGLGDDWSSEEDSYEGGEDDKKKGKNKDKKEENKDDDDSSVEVLSDEDEEKSNIKDKTADEIEKEVDSILKEESQDKKSKSGHKENGSDEEEEEKKSLQTKSTKSILDKKKDSTINVDEEKETLEGNTLVKKDGDEETKKDESGANQEEEKDSEDKELKDDRPTNDDHSEDKDKDNNADEEEPENKPDEPKEPEVTMIDRFKNLPEEFKQRVLNNTIDRSTQKHADKFKYHYHGYSPFPAGPNNSKQGYEAGKIANERFAVKTPPAEDPEKPKYETVTYSESDYLNFNQDCTFEGVSYQSDILRNKYQISLWRCDQFTCVKTKYNYFMDNATGSSLKKDKDTIEKIREHKEYMLNRTKAQKFQGFEIQFSLDKEHIVLVEKRAKNLKKQLVILLDAYTLEVVDEHLVNYSLEHISGLDVEADDEEDYDDGWSEYNTFRHIPNVIVWNKGRYIMVGQTLDKAASIFQYEILDTKEDKNYVISKEDHKSCFFVDFKVSPGNTDVLYVGGYDMTNTHCYEFNIKDESIKEISKGTSTNTRPTLYSLDESCARQFHSRVGTNDKDKNV